MHTPTLAPAASAQPTQQDLKHGVCFNCNNPGHITHNCPHPRTQKIQVSEPSLTLPLPPLEDIQAALTEMVRTAVAEAVQVPQQAEEMLAAKEGQPEDF